MAIRLALFSGICCSACLLQSDRLMAQEKATAALSQAIKKLSPEVLSDDQREAFKDQTWRHLRARGDAVNRRDVENWRVIATREDWERMRDENIARLRKALGGFPDPPKSLDVRVTGSIEGDGFVIENLVYRTRPNFWVTANLYRPSQTQDRMPGILIAHSHHRPKTQGELQDMGMTWARQGCVVLVIDQVGHGERADHPFQSEQDYQKKDSDFRWWRQDYYYRFDTNVQLELTGQSLMGWMVWDLMRGVDLLLARPGVDPDKIIILGAVAGGGDPAAVTAALDRRIAASVPFNFGKVFPTSRLADSDDPDLKFNYLGGTDWESTRNLRRTGVDGFFRWLIVASAAPRALIYAHEFAWDADRDPTWARLNKIYGLYDATDRIDYVVGRGNVRLRPPEATHCTNIGRVHRVRIHQAFQRWFDIDVTQEDEYSQRVESENLRSMTDEARRELKPRKLFEIVTDLGREKVSAARERLANKTPMDRRQQLQADWQALLGDIQPRDEAKVLSEKTETTEGGSVVIHRIALQTEPGIVVPLILLQPTPDKKKTSSRIVVAVSQAGKAGFVRERSAEIAELLDAGAVVCLPDVRGAGKSRGSRGELGSASYYALYFETPLPGLRLRDLRAVMKYLRTRRELGRCDFALWGDSFTPPNRQDTNFQVPKRVNGRPKFSEPLGGLLATLGALYEDDVKAVTIHGGLGGYLDVLPSSYVYIPHDVVIPGVLTQGDLSDLAASLAPCRLRFSGLVDGLNRTLTLSDVRSLYAPAIESYQSIPASIIFSKDRSDVASWLLHGVSD